MRIKKLFIVVVLTLIFLIPLVVADFVENEIQKITHYAEEG